MPKAGIATSRALRGRGEARAAPRADACTQGGVEIEEVVAHDEQAIVREWIDPAVGLMPYQARRLAWALGCTGKVHGEITRVLLALARMGIQHDAAKTENLH